MSELTFGFMAIGASVGLSLMAIGGYCAVKLKELAAHAQQISVDACGVYRECVATRHMNEEVLTYVRRQESYRRLTDHGYADFDVADPEQELALSIEELNAALDALRAVGVNGCAVGAPEACDE